MPSFRIKDTRMSFVLIKTRRGEKEREGQRGVALVFAYFGQAQAYDMIHNTAFSPISRFSPQLTQHRPHKLCGNVCCVQQENSNRKG